MKKTHAILSGLFFALGAALAVLMGGAHLLTGFGKGLNALGQGLRRLSFSGGAGNALAWALLVLLGLTPLLGLLPARRARGKEDILWFAAAAYALFAALSCGIVPSVEEAYRRMGARRFRVFEPDAEHGAEYEALFRRAHAIRIRNGSNGHGGA